MYFKDTSPYPESEVRHLVEFGLSVAGTNHTNVAVHVKGSKYAYAGRSYSSSVPGVSSAHRQARALMTLRVGRTKTLFPADNMGWYPDEPWTELGLLEDRAAREQLAQMKKDSPVQSRTRFANGVGYIDIRRMVRRPYGGKTAPRIEVQDWREALVAIAAHEGRHQYQADNGMPLSEVDAERTAAKALRRFRRLASFPPVIGSP